MMLKTNKKSNIQAIVGIAIVLFTFIVVGGLVNKFVSVADTTEAETICRASAVARSKYSIDVVVDEFRTPLMCKTHDKKIKPTGKDLEEQKGTVIRELSDLAARCWWQFGNGLVGENLFPESWFQDIKCFVCYNTIIQQGSEFKNPESITTAELGKFMFDTPYRLVPESDSCYLGGGKCIPSDQNCGEGDAENYPFYSAIGRCPTDIYGNPTKCCYSPNPCENKGGLCLTDEEYEARFGFDSRCEQQEGQMVCKTESDSNQLGDRAYEPAVQNALWNCKEENENCYVSTETHISYVDYIQNEGGPGKLMPLSNIEPGKAYGITYTVRTKTKNNWWGTAAVIGSVAGATALIIITWGTATPVAVAMVAGTAGAVGGAAAGWGFSELATGIKETFDSEEYDTIHIAAMDLIANEEDPICTVVDDISGK